MDLEFKRERDRADISVLLPLSVIASMNERQSNNL